MARCRALVLDRAGWETFLPSRPPRGRKHDRITPDFCVLDVGPALIAAICCGLAASLLAAGEQD